MIVVDTSAIVAVFRGEAEADQFAALIGADAAPHMSVASVLECSIVMRGIKQLPLGQSEEWLDQFLQSGNFSIDPVDAAQLSLARRAHGLFGKGMGHPAQLNFGDCFAYALAKALDAPLLYKGGDFSKTDIEGAL